jgi:hypothetical protein
MDVLFVWSMLAEVLVMSRLLADVILLFVSSLSSLIDLGPKGGSARFNDRSDRRGGDRGGDRRYDDYNSGPRGGRRSNSRDRDRRPSYRGRSRSRER